MGLPTDPVTPVKTSPPVAPAAPKKDRTQDNRNTQSTGADPTSNHIRQPNFQT